MAYLNGCNIPRVFNLRVFVVKFISTICSVASGLQWGPEGPMIHLGAMMGAGLSQGDSATLGFTTPCAQSGGWLGFRRFRNDKDKRDFITAGAAWRRRDGVRGAHRRVALRVRGGGEPLAAVPRGAHLLRVHDGHVHG